MPTPGSIEDLLKPATPAADPNAQQAAAPTRVSKPVKAAPAKEATTSQKLTATMGSIKLEEKEKEAQQKASDLGFPYILLRGFPIAPEALVLIPRQEAQEKQVIAFLHVGDEVRLATTKPSPEVDAIAKRISESEHVHAEVYFVSDDSFSAAYKLYDTLPEIKEIIYGYRIEEADLLKYEKEISDLHLLQEKINSVSTTDIITLIMGAALHAGASDVHVEAEEEQVKVRFRMDGLLREAALLPKTTWKQMIGRIKLLAGVKINIDDIPQDGRITIYLSKEKIDIRVSFLPTAFGESVVMRILRPKAIALEFDSLGIRGVALERLKKEIEKPNGMIVTTGPTGSGKTTTLYAILKKLNSPEEKIITLEDPIEYKLQGVNQSQINHSHDYDFAKGLRSILRQDPDVVMVGEIRDLETAEIAIQAALTGHLVVSTIHTNSAAGAIPRFMSMGVKPFLLAPALNAVIGQRLVRRLCTGCNVPAELSPSVLEQCKRILGSIHESSGVKMDVTNLKFMAPGKGCDICGKYGYKGRVGIYEIFTMNKEIEHVILSKEVSEYEIAELAAKNGMLTMAQDGLLKALDGLTSVDEVLAVANTDISINEPEEEPTNNA